MDVDQHSGGEIITMSNLGGSQDADIFGKSAGAESESSSEEVKVAGSRRKASEDIKKHSKKKAVRTPSSSTYQSPAKSTRQGSDDGSIAFKNKSKTTM